MTEIHKAIVRRYLDEVWNARKLEVADELVAASYDAIPGMNLRGPGGARALVGFFAEAFPDFVLAAKDVIAEGDRVVVSYEFTGTQRGPWIGLPPTGRRVQVVGLTLYRLVDRRIAESTFTYDVVTLIHQLGAQIVPG